MIGRILNRAVTGIVRVNSYRMGGGHHDHHHEVKLDRDTNWVSYSGDLALASNKFVSLNGFTDTHPAHHYYSNPFPHLYNAPFVSLNNLLYNDPYHHEPDHDPLYNEPHGYLIGDDPMDSRWEFGFPLLAYAIILHLAAGGISFMMRKSNANEPEKVLQREVMTMYVIEDYLTSLKTYLKKLRQEKARLLEKLKQ